jgi:hypothetical protein
LQGMWYMQSIIKLLDIFIDAASRDPEKLFNLCNAHFNLNQGSVKKIKVPETGSYTALCNKGRKVNQTQIEYFVGNTGFAVFIDPMSHVMENVFYTITKGINWKSETSHNLHRQMDDFKKEYQDNTLVPIQRQSTIKIPDKPKSLNLTTVCLIGREKKPPLAEDLEKWLNTNSVNDEYVEIFCQAYDCTDKYRLHLLATEYHEDADTQAGIKYRLKHLSLGVQLDIKDMLKRVYRDAMFLLDTAAAETPATLVTVSWDAHYWTGIQFTLMFRETLLYKTIDRSTADDMHSAENGIQYFIQEGKIEFVNDDTVTEAKIVLNDNDSKWTSEIVETQKLLISLKALNNATNLFYWVFHYNWKHKLLYDEADLGSGGYLNKLIDKTKLYNILWKSVQEQLHAKSKKIQYKLILVENDYNYILIYAHVLYQIATEFDNIENDELDPELEELRIFATLISYLLLVHNQALVASYYIEAADMKGYLVNNESKLNSIKRTLLQLNHRYHDKINEVAKEIKEDIENLENNGGITDFIQKQRDVFWNKSITQRLLYNRHCYFIDNDIPEKSSVEDISTIFDDDEWRLCCGEEHKFSEVVQIALNRTWKTPEGEDKSSIMNLLKNDTSWLRNFFIYGILFEDNTIEKTPAIHKNLFTWFKKNGTWGIHKLAAFMEAFLRSTVREIPPYKTLYKIEKGIRNNIKSEKYGDYTNEYVRQLDFLTPAMFGVYLQTPVVHFADIYFKDIALKRRKDFKDFERKFDRRNAENASSEETEATLKYDISYFYIAQKQSSLLLQVLYRYFGIMMAYEFNKKTCQRVYLQTRFPKLKKNYVPWSIYQTKRHHLPLYKKMEADLKKYLLRGSSVMHTIRRDAPWLRDKELEMQASDSGQNLRRKIDDYFNNKYKLANSIHICWTWKFVSLKLTWRFAYKFKVNESEQEREEQNTESNAGNGSKIENLQKDVMDAENRVREAKALEAETKATANPNRGNDKQNPDIEAKREREAEAEREREAEAKREREAAEAALEQAQEAKREREAAEAEAKRERETEAEREREAAEAAAKQQREAAEVELATLKEALEQAQAEKKAELEQAQAEEKAELEQAQADEKAELEDMQRTLRKGKGAAIQGK